MLLPACGITNPNGKAILDFTSISGAKWIGLPPFQMCKFDITSILVMAPIAIATMMEHVGDMSAISATVGKNYIEDPGLHRTLLGDGLATAFAGFIGGPAYCSGIRSVTILCTKVLSSDLNNAGIHYRWSIIYAIWYDFCNRCS